MISKKICNLIPKLYVIHFKRSLKKGIFQENRYKKHADLVNNIIESNRIYTLNDWKRVRNTILHHENNKGQYNQHNIDALIIGYCALVKNCDLGTSYLNFLNKESIKPNLATLGKYLKLLYAINENTCFKEGKKIPKIEEELILRCYEDLRNQYPILDSISLENAILALSVTSQWKKCTDLIKEIKLTSSPNQVSYSAIVAAAFVNGEEDLAWQLLEEICITGRFPNSTAFLAYFSVLRMLPRTKVSEKLEKLFLFFQSYDFKCQHDVALEISKLADRSNFENKFVSIPYRGVCFNCGNNLERFDLTDDEFEDLKINILQNVIVGKDVFVRTDPLELEKFKRFVAEMGSFDVVMDGLNVAYSAGTKHSPYMLSALVAATVSSFVERKKRVLLMGRVHMTRWPKQNWNYIEENSSVFLTQNISQDDPYLLYCALHSGKNTIIVTRDLMRSHKFLLKSAKHRLLFNRWLTDRQYQLIRVDEKSGPIFRIPPKYSITTQKNNNTWHIPYENDTSNEAFTNNRTKELHKTWLCLSC